VNSLAACSRDLSGLSLSLSPEDERSRFRSLRTSNAERVRQAGAEAGGRAKIRYNAIMRGARRVLTLFPGDAVGRLTWRSPATPRAFRPAQFAAMHRPLSTPGTHSRRGEGEGEDDRAI